MAFLRIQRGIFALGVWHYAGSTAYEGTPLADFFRGNAHGGFRYSISLFDFAIRFRYSISLFDFAIRFRYSISLFDFAIRFRYSISLFDFAIRFPAEGTHQRYSFGAHSGFFFMSGCAAGAAPGAICDWVAESNPPRPTAPSSELPTKKWTQ
jgi:hypothetical protein